MSTRAIALILALCVLPALARPYKHFSAWSAQEAASEAARGNVRPRGPNEPSATWWRTEHRKQEKLRRLREELRRNLAGQ